MRFSLPTVVRAAGNCSKSVRAIRFFGAVPGAAMLFLAIVLIGIGAGAQVSVVTQHNDIGRTGQNLQETTLTPLNVNPAKFGRLFTHGLNGTIYGQPLYMPQVSIPGQAKPHNVVYVATTADIVYAFDADTNSGANGAPLWQVNLVTTLQNGIYAQNGVVGTPTIDPATGTMYVVSWESYNKIYVMRLHALDIATGAEKFGAPVQIQATVPGTGTGSSGGVLAFDPTYEMNRAGLLFLNGVVYFATGSIGDEGPWHGWLFSYGLNPVTQTLQQIDAFCTSPNGTGAGIWMGGTGLSAEATPAKPYGRMFFSTGNGSFTATPPYAKGMGYGMSVVDMDLTGGMLTVTDLFAPYNQASLSAADADLGSGGPHLLPTQTFTSGPNAGKTLNPLVEIGKFGTFYILDRDNNNDGSNNAATEYSPAGLGGNNTTADQVVQEVQTPTAGAFGWGAGLWGTTTYWNNNIYSGGTSVSNLDNNIATQNNLSAYSFINGVMSTTPTSKSPDQYSYPPPTTSVSANANTNGIVWAINTSGWESSPHTAAVLNAYDATNLANEIYSSNTNFARDNPGLAVEFAVPTIANGKVYVGGGGTLTVFGLLAGSPTAPTPTIGPAGGSFSGTLPVTISDSLAGATIYYTTDGTPPTNFSSQAASPVNLTISSNTTITAIASAPGYLLSSPASATYASANYAANPGFSLAAGTYTGKQNLTITEATAGATICYTVDGSTPTVASPCYSPAANGNVPLTISVPVSETVQAIATAPGVNSSPVTSAAYVINPAYTINMSQGFTQALLQGKMTFNGSTDLDDFRLQLTNGGINQAGSAFYTSLINIKAFTTDFTFQLSNPLADGITFCIQGVGPTQLGGAGAGLGFVTMQNSVAIKFDLFSNAGEGRNSTGLYTRGNLPTLPALDLTPSGIDLHDGNTKNVHITYDGTNLTMTITDPLTLATFSSSWAINIPQKVGSNYAYVGFTGSSGGQSASQKVTSWTFTSAAVPVPNFPVGFDNVLMSSRGAWVNGTGLQLTNGGGSDNNNAFYFLPVNIDNFTSAFDFTIAPGSTSTLGDGFAFVIQNSGLDPIDGGSGGLGYAGLANSVAIKFDTFNNAGEGASSTGVYVNGAMPTVPSLDMTGSGILIGNGQKYHVVVSYDGATLKWTVQNTTSPTQIFQGSQVINIPHTINSNTAWIGFTASSGDGTSSQEILDWTYSNTQ